MDPIACGVEISARSLEVCLRAGAGGFEHRQLPNTSRGHRQLVRWLRRQKRPARVCLEATGQYGLDLALALSESSGVEVMVANPRAARRFAEALMQRAKTDRVDAEMLCQFVERMPWEPWQPPSCEALALRALTRRIQALTAQRTAERNRYHAAQASRTTPASLRQSLKRQIRGLDREIKRLGDEARQLIARHGELQERYRLLLTIPGIGPKSAASLLGELAVLPSDLDARQWVAHAGLDPKPVESGSSVRLPRRISRTGNPRLRHALYMPALVAKHWDPHCRLFCEQLHQRGLRPIQALVALMRKLLHAIYGVWTHQQDFDATKLFPNLNPNA